MLEGKKIRLRNLQLNDFTKTVIWRRDRDVKKYAMMHPFPVTDELEETWYKSYLTSKDNHQIYFGIEEKTQEELVGYIQLKNINWLSRNCDLGIVIGSQSARGHGYGYEAMELILDYVFNSLNLHKISLKVISFNQTALNLYKKLGFLIEGTLKEHYWTDGQYYDVYILGKLNN
ncbi:MAG: GNAT family N-acetyltransferase [Leptospiraceae bacterium]|nr:GNAT family N-acetyltransferase [candidate division KSB1 bacterium]MCP5498217.1 GNAT family N-acetyltransferase [Leptospiraceae bacterium]